MRHPFRQLLDLHFENQNFRTFEQWVNKASTWLTDHPNYSDGRHWFRALCFDSRGRRCSVGTDFMRARDENAFPVYWVWPDQIGDLMLELMAYRSGDDALAKDIQAHINGTSIGPNDPETYPMPRQGWVCFHCGERFRTPEGARHHFGVDQDVEPQCRRADPWERLEANMQATKKDLEEIGDDSLLSHFKTFDIHVGSKR